VKLLMFTVAFAVMVVLVGRAWDHELARGSVLSERGEGSEGSDPGTPGVRQRGTAVPSPSRSESTYQGKTIRWWAKRAVQARKDANARGQTIRRLQNAQRNDASHFFAWLRGADCIYRNERGADGWATRTGNGYYGGMQADLSFQRAYGRPYLRWGTADNWPMWAQLHMAYNGWIARGWDPWPNTARECGLR
jgi:hypothetical protein